VGLADPRGEVPVDYGKADVLYRLVFEPLRVVICVSDPYLTPITWNAIADAWWGLSRSMRRPNGISWRESTSRLS